jgi:hypothetical protein
MPKETPIRRIGTARAIARLVAGNIRELPIPARMRQATIWSQWFARSPIPLAAKNAVAIASSIDRRLPRRSAKPPVVQARIPAVPK